MTRYRCWDPDAGETFEDATDINARNERDAAEVYAEKCFRDGDAFSSMNVRVAAWSSGSSSAVDVVVAVEMSPVFLGSRPKAVS